MGALDGGLLRQSAASSNTDHAHSVARTAQERWQETCHPPAVSGDPSIQALSRIFGRLGLDIAAYFLLRAETSGRAEGRNRSGQAGRPWPGTGLLSGWKCAD